MPASPQESSPPAEVAEPTPRIGRPGRRPRRVNPAVPADTGFECEVSIANIPLSTARNLKLQVGRSTRPITSTRMRVKVDKKTLVSITEGDWRGSVTLTRDACAAGAVPLQAKPRPAVVRIVGAPPEAVARCLSGCKKKDVGANQTPDKGLRAIPIADGTSQRVKFAFQAAGYHDLKQEWTLHPGVQTLRVKMRPRGN